MIELSELRRQNGRNVIASHGGVGRVATLMGYPSPSFLVQIYGPNPSRKPTERTTRKMEQSLGLEVGTLDQPPSNVNPPAETISFISDLIQLVGKVFEQEGVSVSPGRFANVVALAYTDAMEQKRTPREQYIEKLVLLLK